MAAGTSRPLEQEGVWCAEKSGGSPISGRPCLGKVPKNFLHVLGRDFPRAWTGADTWISGFGVNGPPRVVDKFARHGVLAGDVAIGGVSSCFSHHVCVPWVGGVSDLGDGDYRPQHLQHSTR